MKLFPTILLCAISNVLTSQIAASQEEFETKSTTSAIKFEFDEVRALTEINSPKTGDSYPWISNDGLRLYFSQETNNHDEFMVSSRTDVNSDFETPVPLSIGSNQDDNLSMWLTPDELTIYFVTREVHGEYTTTLHKVTRLSIGDEFNTYSIITLLGDASGFISSPSFTNDLKELYLYNSPGSYSNKILLFEQVDELTYSLKDSLPIPSRLFVNPGKLGHDGLKFYLPLDGPKPYFNKMYLYERESTNSPFGLPRCLSNESINDSSDIGQPTTSNDGNYFVFTRNTGTWDSNDLYIAQRESDPLAIKDYIKTSQSEISIYPNPAVNYLNIKIISAFKSNQLMVSIYSIDGVLIQSTIHPNDNDFLRLSTDRCASGIYLMSISGNNMPAVSKKFVVRK